MFVTPLQIKHQGLYSFLSEERQVSALFVAFVTGYKVPGSTERFKLVTFRTFTLSTKEF